MDRGRFILSSEQFLRRRSRRKSQRRSSAPTSKTKRERSGRTSRTWGKRSTGSQKIWSRSTTIWEQMSLMISGMYNCTKYPIQQRTIYSVHGQCRQNYFLNISVQTDGNGRRSQSLPRCRRRQIRETVRKSEDFLIFRGFILSPGKGPWRWRKSTKHWYQRRTPKNDLRYGQSHRTLGSCNKVKLTNINCLSIFLNRAEIKEEVKRITPMDVYMKVIFSLLPPNLYSLNTQNKNKVQCILKRCHCLVSGRDWCHVIFQLGSQVYDVHPHLLFIPHGFCSIQPAKARVETGFHRRDCCRRFQQQVSIRLYLRLRFIALIQMHSNPHLLSLPSQFSCLPMPKTRELRQKLFERKFGQFTRRSKIKRARKASKYQMQQIHKKESETRIPQRVLWRLLQEVCPKTLWETRYQMVLPTS